MLMHIPVIGNELLKKRLKEVTLNEGAQRRIGQPHEQALVHHQRHYKLIKDWVIE